MLILGVSFLSCITEASFKYWKKKYYCPCNFPLHSHFTVLKENWSRTIQRYLCLKLQVCYYPCIKLEQWQHMDVKELPKFMQQFSRKADKFSCQCTKQLPCLLFNVAS